MRNRHPPRRRIRDGTDRQRRDGRGCRLWGPSRSDSASPRSGWLSSSSAAHHGRFQPGALVGDRYRITGRLGRGGMGEVYGADDLKLGQPVALTFLPESVERDPVRLAQLHSEVRLSRQISHRNVCRIYDIGDADGRTGPTMEYVDGDDLSVLLRRIGRLPEDKALDDFPAVAVAGAVLAGLTLFGGWAARSEPRG